MPLVGGVDENLGLRMARLHPRHPLRFNQSLSARFTLGGARGETFPLY